MNSGRIVDRRLLGAWRSDKTQTLSEWRFAPGTSPEASAKVEALFGKLVLRYTRARVFTEFEGDKTVCPYRVVAADEQSVAMETSGTDHDFLNLLLVIVVRPLLLRSQSRGQ